MNNRIYIVDRVDQVKWYIDDTATSFSLQLKDNHKELREWLEAMTHDVVVISGNGSVPRTNQSTLITEAVLSPFGSIPREQYKLFFANEDDALLFKLTWGGN